MTLRDMVVPALALAVLLGAAPQGDKPKSIKDAMNSVHKGKESVVAKAAAGKGSDEDHKRLVDIYEFLAAQKPPMGDEASWKAKTSALIAASKNLVDKKAGAADEFKKASDCKACHSVHKPPSK